MRQFLDPVIEELFSRASVRWRWFRFLQRSAILGTITLIAFFLLGVGITVGWLSSPGWVIACFVLVVLVSGFVWLLVGITTGFASENRRWLAASVEHQHLPLMDRLNTLVFLEQERDRGAENAADPVQLEIAEQIEQQARQVLIRRPPPLPFSLVGVAAHFTMFAALLMATVLFYGYCQPWRKLMAASPFPQSVPKDPFVEIPPLEEASEPLVKEEAAWGEVRITEPGRDLLATRLDVVPLRIEAAANRPLQDVELVMTVNGQEEISRKLSPPQDPCYAVYDLELRLEDHKVETWDVISYFARAATEDGQVYISDVYTIEVLPFREELDDLSAGSESPGFEMLEKLTASIRRQQEVLRQTYHQKQATEQQPADWQQYNQKLAREEADLSRATEHVSAEIASRFESAPTEKLDDHFQRTESALKNAEKALLDSDPSVAQQHERDALSEMIAARKQFQQLLDTNREAFRPSTQEPPAGSSNPEGEETPGLDEEKALQAQQQLFEQHNQQEQMAATEKQLNSARQFVQQTLQKQRDLEQRANPRARDTLPKLAEEQRQLRRSLEEFVEKNPESFHEAQKECSRAQSAMQQAATSMDTKNSRAQQQAGQAGEELRELDNALQRQQQLNRLADAHRLRQMLKEQISQLEQCQQHGAPTGQCQKLGWQAKSTTGQLKQIAEQEQSSGRFGPQLGEALSDQQKLRVDAQADQLARASDRDGQSRASGELRQELQKIARAFDASCPNPAGSNGENGRLRATGQQAIAQGIQSLQSSARRQASGRPSSGKDQALLGREATANLQAGIFGIYGHNDRTQQVLDKVERDLGEPEFPLNLRTVEELMHEIQQLGHEVAVDKDPEAQQAESRHLDPAQLPPSYRKSIEKYFEKLSER